MIQTFQTLLQVDPGFRDPGNVQTFQLTIPTADLPDAERAGVPGPEPTIRMQHEILDRLAAVAGVESAGFSSSNDGLPLDGDGKTRSIFVEGRTPAVGQASLKEIQFVSPHFFETLRTPLIAGRTFDWSDVHQGRRVVLVSDNLARAEWGSARAALGRRVGSRPTGPWSEVVGVVKDVHHNGLSQPAPETVIFPPRADDTASFVIRSERVGTVSFLEDLRRAVWSVDANLSLASDGVTVVRRQSAGSADPPGGSARSGCRRGTGQLPFSTEGVCTRSRRSSEGGVTTKVRILMRNFAARGTERLYCSALRHSGMPCRTLRPNQRRWFCKGLPKEAV